MRVLYTIGGEVDMMETEADDDLRELAREIYERLSQRHPELNGNPRLPVVIADGMLNSLADDLDEVTLGTLD